VFDFAPIQIIIVLVILLLIFGSTRLPALGRNLGKGLRGFKGGITGEDADPDNTDPDPARTAAERAAQRVEAHQEVPAPTPEIAAAEAADEERGSSR
jgi:sec-independent protein translocase protein TatA